MKTPLLAALAGAVIAVCTSAAPAFAHHSHAMFDDSREVTITGKVTGIQFVNPHVYLAVDVVGEDGRTSRWTVEMSHVGNMISRGVKADTFQVGDDVTITMNPLRNGQSGGNYTRIESINGVQNTAEGNAWSAE